MCPLSRCDAPIMRARQAYCGLGDGSTMSLRRARTIFAAIALLCAAPLLLHAGPLDDLQPGQWYEVPNSKLNALDPCPTNDCAYTGNEGQAAVMDDWAGGAYDTARERLMVWGGGHGGYGGNEVYAFDVNTLTWSRLTEPSDPITLCASTYPDGRPASSHSYNQLQYLPTLDVFATFGVGTFCEQGGIDTPSTAVLNLTTHQWSQRAPRPDQAEEKEFGTFSALDGNGNVWVHTNEAGRRFHKYTLDTDTWTTYSSEAIYYASQGATAAIDTVRNRLVAIGESGGYANNLFAQAWDLNNPDEAATVLSGVPVSLASPGAPGMVYDPIGDRFLLWNGGTTVHTLNAADLTTWGTVPLYSANSVIPSAPNSRGTYGRLRYIPSKQALIVVNATDENVYLFKLHAGSVASPTLTLNATPSTALAYQGSVTLTWSSTDATACTASGAWSGAMPLSGSQTLTNLTASGTYTLSCSGPGGNAVQSAVLTVSGAQATTTRRHGGALSPACLAALCGFGVLARHRRLRRQHASIPSQPA